MFQDLTTDRDRVNAWCDTAQRQYETQRHLEMTSQVDTMRTRHAASVDDVSAHETKTTTMCVTIRVPGTTIKECDVTTHAW